MPSPLCAFGHVATMSELLAIWGQRSAVEPLLRHPGVVRLRRGLYVCRDIDEQDLIAAEIGGRVDCLSLLGHHGLVDAADGSLHLRFEVNHGRASGRRRLRADVVAHWSAARVRPLGIAEARSMTRATIRQGGVVALSRLRVPVADALAQALRGCLPLGDASAVLDQLIERRILTPMEIAGILSELPERLRRHF